MKFVEKVNLVRLNEVIALNNDEYNKQLIPFKKLLDSEGKATFEYELKKDKGFGRMYTNYGLQFIKKEIRNYITEEYCVDVDIVNCHPTLLLYFLKKYNIQCQELEEYVNNREVVLKRENTDKLQINYAMFKKDYHGNAFYKKINKIVYTFLVDELKKEYSVIDDYINNFKPKKNNNDEFAGSFVALVLQDFECKIIRKCIEYLESKNITICSYMFDGFLLYKHDLVNEQLLSDLSSFVKKEFDVDIKFIFKSMENSDIIKSITKQNEDYQIWKKNFEKNHFKLIDKEGYIRISEFNEYKLWKFTGLLDFLYSTVEGFNIDFLKKWSCDTNILTYEKMDFCPPPLKCHPKIYNLWKGYELENYIIQNKVDDEKVIEKFDKFMNHICSNDHKIKTYFTAWIAQIIQEPGKKSGVCPVISSLQGSGKGTLFNIITNLIGTDYCIITASADHVLSRFNDVLEKSFVVAFDEALSQKMIEGNSILKNLITEPTITIEAKGQPKRQINSCHRIMIFTNETNPVKIAEGDRRYFVLDPPPIMTQEQKDYFFENKDIFTKDEYKIIFDHLKNIDINYNWQVDRPITKKYLEIAEHYVQIIHSWLIVFTRKYSDKYVKGIDIYNHYLEYMNKQESERHKIGSSKFFKLIKKFPNNEWKRSDATYRSFNFNTIQNYLIDNKLVPSTYDFDEVDPVLYEFNSLTKD